MMPSKPKVVVGGQDVVVAMHLRELLNHRGYEVSAVAYSTRDAVRACRRHLPDAMVLDISHHKSLQRQDPTDSIWSQVKIPVILLISDNDRPQDSCMTGGPIPLCIRKPFTENEIITALETCRGYR